MPAAVPPETFEDAQQKPKVVRVQRCLVDIYYFAYGSNLCFRRLRDRVPGVRPVGPAVLQGYSLHWHKRSVDGSGKCSVAKCSTDVVHGVLFAIPPEEKARLDQVEGLGHGYDEIEMAVEAGGGTVVAHTYVAADDYVDELLKPYSWYRDLAVAGAQAYGLPSEYIASLQQVDAIEDPSPERDRMNRRSLRCGAGWATDLASYERQAIAALVGGHLPLDVVTSVLADGELVSLEHTGAGYYLTVSHPSLPTERVVCNEPLLIGRVGELECGFVVFLENGELTLECHSWSEAGLPTDLRSRDVVIEAAP